MKRIYIYFICLFVLFISPVTAGCLPDCDCTYTTGYAGGTADQIIIGFNNIEDYYDNVNLIQFLVKRSTWGTQYFSYPFSAHIDSYDGTEIGIGTVSRFTIDATYDEYSWDFTNWDIGAATGNHKIYLLWSGANTTTSCYRSTSSAPSNSCVSGCTDHAVGVHDTILGADRAASQYYDLVICGDIPPTPTPTPYPGTLSVNLYEKYSNAILINQAITITPTEGGEGETKTSLYGETLHFGVVPGASYWFNATRTGYQDYNETYTIPADPGIYAVYMERTMTPYEGMNYTHFSVVDQTNGGLIPNAQIVISDGQTKLTNSAGYTWFLVNQSTPYTYTVSKTGYFIPASGSFNITEDTSILVALQRSTGPTPTWVLPSWTPVTVPTTGSGVDPVVTLSAALREQNVQEGMDVWYTNLPFISQFLFLLFIIGGLGLMAGGTRRN